MRSLIIIIMCVFCISCNCNSNNLSEAISLQQEYRAGKYSLNSFDIQEAFIEEGIAFDCIENRYCRYLIPVEYTAGNCKPDSSRIDHLFPAGTRQLQLSKSAAEELAKQFPPRYCIMERYGTWPSITVSGKKHKMPGAFSARTFYKYIRGQLMKQKKYADDRITEYLTSNFAEISDSPIRRLEIETQHDLLCSTEKSNYFSCINDQSNTKSEVTGYILSGPFIGCHVYLFDMDGERHLDFEWTTQTRNQCKRLNDKAQTIIENAGPFPKELTSQ